MLWTKKKKVTLPKNFDALIEAKDIEALKAIYERCELYATYDDKYENNTALHHYSIPTELATWLIKQGLDINIENYHRQTPLCRHIRVGRGDLVKLLIELGGDIEKADQYSNSPLHLAAKFFHTDIVRFLVKEGANVRVKNDMGQTPLAASLSACNNINICEMSKIAAMLLQAGDEITPEMVESVKQIGKQFEIHRENFSKDLLSEADSGLKELYALFGVSPIAKHKIHDGVSPIVVQGQSWEERYEALWNLLVPSVGAAKTVQGEVVRITGRVRDEIHMNGSINWDGDYRKMLDALLQYFASGTPLSEEELEDARRLVSQVQAGGDAEEFVTERLCELSTKWVLSNPNPILLDRPNYTR